MHVSELSSPLSSRRRSSTLTFYCLRSLRIRPPAHTTTAHPVGDALTQAWSYSDGGGASRGGKHGRFGDRQTATPGIQARGRHCNALSCMRWQLQLDQHFLICFFIHLAGLALGKELGIRSGTPGSTGTRVRPLGAQGA